MKRPLPNTFLPIFSQASHYPAGHLSDASSTTHPIHKYMRSFETKHAGSMALVPMDCWLNSDQFKKKESSKRSKIGRFRAFLVFIKACSYGHMDIFIQKSGIFAQARAKVGSGQLTTSAPSLAFGTKDSYILLPHNHSLLLLRYIQPAACQLWWQSPTHQVPISGVSSRILKLSKAKLAYSMSRLRLPTVWYSVCQACQLKWGSLGWTIS